VGRLRAGGRLPCVRHAKTQTAEISIGRWAWHERRFNRMMTAFAMMIMTCRPPSVRDFPYSTVRLGIRQALLLQIRRRPAAVRGGGQERLRRQRIPACAGIMRHGSRHALHGVRGQGVRRKPSNRSMSVLPMSGFPNAMYRVWGPSHKAITRFREGRLGPAICPPPRARRPWDSQAGCPCHFSHTLSVSSGFRLGQGVCMDGVAFLEDDLLLRNSDYLPAGDSSALCQFSDVSVYHGPPSDAQDGLDLEGRRPFRRGRCGFRCRQWDRDRRHGRRDIGRTHRRRDMSRTRLIECV
jgi:hypothetical protein